MKVIVDDPQAFFEDGGWKFLDPESDVSAQRSNRSLGSLFQDSEQPRFVIRPSTAVSPDGGGGHNVVTA